MTVKLFKSISYTIFSFLIVFSILEISCRVYDHFTMLKQDYPDLRHLEPYLMFSPKPNQNTKTDQGEININSMGFRGKEITIHKSDSTYRIVMLGGSVGFNGTSDSTTIIGYVGHLLRGKIKEYNSDKNIETINAAVPSYISKQEMLLLILKIVDLNPDLVIVFDGINDWAQFHLEPRVGYPYLFSNLEKAISPPSFSKVFRETIELSSFIKHFEKWLHSITVFVKKIAKNILPEKIVNKIKESKGITSSVTKDIQNKAVELYVKNHIKMEIICNNYNIKCIHINQPNLARRDRLTKDETSIFNLKYSENILRMESEAIKRLNSMYEKRSILFYDFGDIFDNEERTIFIDFAHFVDTDYANYKIAQKIVGIIFEEKLL